MLLFALLISGCAIKHYTDYIDEASSLNHHRELFSSAKTGDYLMSISITYPADYSGYHFGYVPEKLKGFLVTQISINRAISNKPVEFKDCSIQLVDENNTIIPYQSIEVENKNIYISYTNENDLMRMNPILKESDLSSRNIYYRYDYSLLEKFNSVKIKVRIKMSIDGEEFTIEKEAKLKRVEKTTVESPIFY